ncbi:hypothetical protein [Nibribacter koreensis]|uniref:Uncharacterized protein n=1 Tax=Nibribacter koreensis TaxID=1084519 RepID=A0ABP8FFX9_9BACT
MLTLLDCVYLISCDFYKSREADSFKAIGAVMMGALFLFNLLLLVFVFEPYYTSRWGENFIYAAALYSTALYVLVLMPALYVRYFRVTNYEAVLRKLQEMAEGKKILYLVLAHGYAVSSVLMFFTYVFYKGGQVNGWW